MIVMLQSNMKVICKSGTIQVTITSSKSTIEKLKKRCKICSKSTTESEICSKFKWYKPFPNGSNVDMEQVNVSWEKS